MKRRIFISTTEFSGDMHGESLVRELQKICPELEFYGVGGSRMADAGVKLIYDPTKQSTLGFTEAIKNVKKFKKLIKDIAHSWDEQRPDLMLWLDSGGFNLILAKEASQRGIPVICMFSPSAWAYGQSRAVKLAQRVKLLLAVLPFEADFYRKFGTNVTYVGHPLFDRVKSSTTAANFREQHQITSDQKLLALLPGSRRQEVAGLLPVMLEAAVKLNDPTLRLMIPVAASIDREWLQALVAEYPLSVELLNGGSYELLDAADAAILASGTATLEAAILNAPMVVVYRVSKLSYFIYRCLEAAEYKERSFIALPNLIAGKRIVTELTQEHLTAENITKAIRPILYDEGVNQSLRAQLHEVKELIGPAGVMARAAKLIIQLLDEQIEPKEQ